MDIEITGVAVLFFFSSRRRHTRFDCDWSSDVCSSDLRRLLKDGYAFGDIRAALLAEAQVQQEEAEVIKQRRLFRRLDSLWYRVWAGRAGRSFFRLAGVGLKATARPALPSVERTELVLGRSALSAYKALPEGERRQAPDLPGVVGRLETGDRKRPRLNSSP